MCGWAAGAAVVTAGAAANTAGMAAAIPEPSVTAANRAARDLLIGGPFSGGGLGLGVVFRGEEDDPLFPQAFSVCGA